MVQQKKIQALKNILVAEYIINAWGDLEESIKLEEFCYKNTIKNQTRINSCLSNVQSNPASFTELVAEFCKMELLQASFTELIVKGFCNHLEICFTEL
jgi:hypothetical protein